MFGDRSGAERGSSFKFVSGPSSGLKKQQREAVDVSVPTPEVKYACGSVCNFP